MKVEWVAEEGVVPGVGKYSTGDVVDLPQEVADLWIARNWAKPVMTEFILNVNSEGELQ